MPQNLSLVGAQRLALGAGSLLHSRERRFRDLKRPVRVKSRGGGFGDVLCGESLARGVAHHLTIGGIDQLDDVRARQRLADIGVALVARRDRLAQFATEIERREGLAPRHERLDDLVGVEFGLPQTRFAADAAMLELPLKRPCAQDFRIETVGKGLAVLGVDPADHEMQMRVIRIVMGDNDSPCVRHAEFRKRGMRGGFHFDARRFLVGMPRKRQMQTVREAFLGF